MSRIVTQVRRDARAHAIRLVALGMLLLLPMPSMAQQGPSTIDVAKAYGLDSFGQIETIRYTWNAEAPFGTVARTWEWSPKTDTVSYDGKD